MLQDQEEVYIYIYCTGYKKRNDFCHCRNKNSTSFCQFSSLPRREWRELCKLFARSAFSIFYLYYSDIKVGKNLRDACHEKWKFSIWIFAFCARNEIIPVAFLGSEMTNLSNSFGSGNMIDRDLYIPKKKSRLFLLFWLWRYINVSAIRQNENRRWKIYINFWIDCGRKLIVEIFYWKREA